MLKNVKISIKTSILVAIVLTVGFVILAKSIDEKSCNLVNSQITNQMLDAVESRSQIIDDYVTEAERKMLIYSMDQSIVDILRTKGEDEAARNRAQKYTEQFAGACENMEGLYVSNLDTVVLAHNNKNVIGLQTRKDDSLKEFQKQVYIENKLSNLGIIKSPSSGSMVISMYYPVFENQVCLGFVGAAVHADTLMESLEALRMNGIENCEYIFLNVKTGEYLYSQDESLLCTVTEEKGCVQLLETLRSNSTKTYGMFDYVDDLGIKQIIAYRYLPERDWVFALKDTSEHVYSSLVDIRKTSIVVSVVIGLVTLIILAYVLSRIGKKLTIISKSIEKLGNMDLTASQGISIMSGTKDEIGTICSAMEKTCDNLSFYIGEIGNQLRRMAHGDFQKKDEVAFEGEFRKLNQSMDEIQMALSQSFTQLRTVTNELVAGSQSVADTASRLATTANDSNILVREIDANINDISEQVSVSAQLAKHVKGESQQASELVMTSSNKMQDLSGAMSQISQATEALAGISNSLEKISKQTNILALNALVEAHRAGMEGRGFAVVADEIRVLAEQSREAAAHSDTIIQEIIERVKDGLKFGDETADYLQQMVNQTNTINESVSQIAQATSMQNEKLSTIRDRLHDIGKTVEVTAEMSQQSAAASIELDSQTKVLDENIGRYKV